MEADEFAFKIGESLSKNRGKLHTITAYEKPLDYPEHYVARLSLIIDGDIFNTDIFTLADSFEELEAMIPNVYFAWFPSCEGDELHILGTWI